MAANPELREQLEQAISANKGLLLMKGTPDMPRPLRPRRHFWARLWPWSGTPAAVAELHACAAAVTSDAFSSASACGAVVLRSRCGQL